MDSSKKNKQSKESVPETVNITFILKFITFKLFLVVAWGWSGL